MCNGRCACSACRTGSPGPGDRRRGRGVMVRAGRCAMVAACAELLPNRLAVPFGSADAARQDKRLRRPRPVADISFAVELNPAETRERLVLGVPNDNENILRLHFGPSLL